VDQLGEPIDNIPVTRHCKVFCCCEKH
jgi:hypothetical protein